MKQLILIAIIMTTLAAQASLQYDPRSQSMVRVQVDDDDDTAKIYNYETGTIQRGTVDRRDDDSSRVYNRNTGSSYNVEDDDD